MKTQLCWPLMPLLLLTSPHVAHSSHCFPGTCASGSALQEGRTKEENGFHTPSCGSHLGPRQACASSRACNQSLLLSHFRSCCSLAARKLLSNSNQICCASAQHPLIAPASLRGSSDAMHSPAARLVTCLAFGTPWLNNHRPAVDSCLCPAPCFPDHPWLALYPRSGLTAPAISSERPSLMV